MVTGTQPIFAQTNLQLFDQMRRQAYGEADLAAVDCAYRFAMQLFPGQYRGSGKPFLCHLVGTASVLASLRLPSSIVAAGLLHSVYALGEFGSGWLGISEVKRRVVGERVGSEIEQHIYRYTELPWRDDTPAELLDRLLRDEQIDRDTTVIRLANEVDDHLDLGILYCGGATERVRRANQIQQPCVELAKRLGYPALAAALGDTLGRCGAEAVATNLRQSRDLSFTVPVLLRARWRLGRLRHLLRGVSR